MFTVKSHYPVRFGMVSVDKIYSDYDVESSDRYRKNPVHFQRLLESVVHGGLRNPLVVQTRLDGLAEVTVGYSRIWAAKKAGVSSVACFVNDAVNLYPEFEAVLSIDHARKFFRDQPVKIIFTKIGISTSEPLVDDKSWWQD
jgi:hypothetical protein